MILEKIPQLARPRAEERTIREARVGLEYVGVAVLNALTNPESFSGHTVISGRDGSWCSTGGPYMPIRWFIPIGRRSACFRSATSS